MTHFVGLGLLVYLIAFAFGETTARVVVGTGLLAVAAFFMYILIRVVLGTI